MSVGSFHKSEIDQKVPDEINQKPSFLDVIAVVIDTGSSGCRVGFANEDAPRVVTKFKKESSPIRYGHIVDKDKLVKEWIKALSYKELVYSEQPLLITTPTVISRTELETIAQIAFEVFEASAMLPFDQSILSLYSAGKVTGLIVDCGHELTSSVPIVESKVYHPGVVTSQLGGEDVSKYLGELLGRQNFLDDIKEKACQVRATRDYGNKFQKAECNLVNGEVILLGKERFESPEILFRPELINRNPGRLSIQETVYLSMQKCDKETRNELYKNIVLTGGSSMFNHFGTRLKNCLEMLSPSTTTIKVDDTHAAGRYMAWVGGSIVASAQPLKFTWITKRDYSEKGPTIINNVGT
ncbi:unnamed protein product [Hymenolepis diminuta]|uniref:Actin n=1 Tax=Hymenolepis diminuta TaxID=6216 RepID=A0A0R3SL12_HYMDI|nr:unnamed protein product [Hymenolepis diminuta]VUZ39205.1 unnamed protein product [Hymenolepis diminuta]